MVSVCLVGALLGAGRIETLGESHGLRDAIAEPHGFAKQLFIAEGPRDVAVHAYLENLVPVTQHGTGCHRDDGWSMQRLQLAIAPKRARA